MIGQLIPNDQNPQYSELRPQTNVVTQAAAPAIAPSTPATYMFSRAGVTAATLAAPNVGSGPLGDDGKEIEFVSTTANAHTVTATGLFQTGTAAVNLATFAAFAGAGFTIRAYQGKWLVIKSVGITFT